MGFKIISNEEATTIQMKQNETQQIVLDEIDRLRVKKSNLDAERNNAERMILLNQSFRDRQQQYLMTMLVFLFLFSISLAIVFCQEKLGITTQFMDLLLVIIVVIGIVVAVVMFSDIFSRDNLDFSKLKEEGGKLIHVQNKKKTDDAANAAALSAGQVTQALGTMCKGADCCGPGFVWDTSMCKVMVSV